MNWRKTFASKPGVGTAVILILVASRLTSTEERTSEPPPRTGDVVPTMRADGTPWLQLASTTGELIGIGDLRGQPAVINLWASWCPPCRMEMPYLQAVHERFSKKGLRVIGISQDKGISNSDLVSVRNKLGAHYQALRDPRGISMARFGVTGLPTTIVLDGEGRIRLFRVGIIREGDEAFEATLSDITGTLP